MKHYNIHSHIFTMNNAPERFLHLYLPDFAADIIDNVTNTSIGANIVKNLLNTFGGNGGKRYASFLSIGKSKNQSHVFENLIKQYDDDIIFIALTMFMENCGAGASKSGFDGQIQEALNVRKEYPDRLRLFLGVDPRWEANGMDIRDRVVEYFDTPLEINESRWVYPFCGIKIYPSTGFYGFDRRLMDTLKWAEANSVPVLSHCNYLGGIFNNNKSYLEANLSTTDPYTNMAYKGEYIREKKPLRFILGTQESTNNRSSCSYFMEPMSFKSILQQLPSLKLCLAHYGGDNQIKDSLSSKVPHGTAKKNWHLQIKEMMADHPGLYTDISYAVHKKGLFELFFEHLNTPDIGNRIMFGTDYFLTEREKSEKNIYLDFKKAAMAKSLSNHGGVSAWDLSASINTEMFLQSKYF